VGKVHERIDDRLRGFLERQHVFFVGTAPTEPGGHVNVSPKGIGGTFAVVDDHTVAYLDITASGAETIAHLRDNGRIVLMLCAFEGPPRIVRLHGRGEVLPAGAVAFDSTPPPGTERAVIRVAVERIADSCGYGVPVMRFEGRRPQYERWAEAKRRKGGEHALDDYMARHNERSIDGLPAVDAGDLEPA
jgi:hypothetical protein